MNRGANSHASDPAAHRDDPLVTGGLMNPAEHHARASEQFDARVEEIRDDQWAGPTPDGLWAVRDLVNHLVYGNRWVPEMVNGRTIEEIGDRFDGDLLGRDPKGAWKDSSRDAVGAFLEEAALERTVHLSFGDVPCSEYAHQRGGDVLVHTWDLARAIGADESLPDDLCRSTLEYHLPYDEMLRGEGGLGPKLETPPGADVQTELLAFFGRRSQRDDGP
ncbi:MAG: TIGR03086 family metal-binding protein [Actinomycetota bacterium]|nr:TIGR03086 family metal-binding protein [Actinomycetota bacterium]